MKIKNRLESIIAQSLHSLSLPNDKVIVSEASKIEFGDYQFNGMMAIAKKMKTNPRELALLVMNNIKDDEMIAKMEVAGAGFINIWLKDNFLSSNINILLNDDRLGVAKSLKTQRVVLDYSSPNMGKQMHVGHLRSTIIGDALGNLFEFLGDEVIRQNHIGDWGTQFGMLIAYLEENKTSSNSSLSDLESFYQNAKKRFAEDEAFANKSRENVVKLQAKEEHALKLWDEFIDTSLHHCEYVYDKLGVNLKREDIRGESFYNDDLPVLLEDLDKLNLLTQSQGASCVFLNENLPPVIVKKSDGAYLYATTDLSALRYRTKQLNASRICYVADSRQAEHFKQIFEVAQKASFVEEQTRLEHIGFGMVMDKSGKPFKSRDGGTVKLIDLLDEAILRAGESIKKRDEYSEVELQNIASIVGIGAVKYADLSLHRESNYMFDWNKMLSFEGNTALYIQYAYARINSILERFDGKLDGNVLIGDELEHRLALMLLRFEDVLLKASLEAMPHVISSYLYDLVTLFMKFYENNPILKDGIQKDVKMSRLILSFATANIIKKALKILGIKVANKI
ncbi:MAG: arginine--tRNA ligase [Sulfurovum sp.]|nr:MAG: arginine--tRNA ligase [Sulfurovum sp.]